MADGGYHYAGVTIDTPILEDYCWIARRMRPDEIEQHVAFHGDEEYDPNLAALRMANYPGPAWTFVAADGLPIVVCGFLPCGDGVWAAWMAGTMDRWTTHWRTITRLCRRITDSMLAQEGVSEIQITALAGRTAAHEWYERSLGYERAGEVPFGEGREALLFKRAR